MCRSTSIVGLILLLGVAPAAAGEPCRDGADAARQRDLAKAELLLKQCIQTQPAIETYLLLAGVYQLQQKSTELYEIASEALKRFPAEQRFYIAVANHDGREKRFQPAIRILEEAFRRWPGDPKIQTLLASSHFGRGSELLDEGRNEAAVDHLRRATELAPADVEARMNLGRALHNLHRRVEAMAVFDALVRQTPPVPLARFHRALTYYSMGEFVRAIEDLDGEIAAKADDGPARLVRGLSLMATGEWTKAAADLEIAAAALPDNAQAQYGRARALIESGELASAEAVLRKAIALDPADPGPLNSLVRLLVRLGRRDEANALAPKAAELARKSRTANPGEIRFESFKRSPQ